MKEHQTIHQIGGKRNLKSQEQSPNKKPKLPEKVNGILPADKEVSAMKGAKVDAFFYPKTEAQKTDLQVLFKETFPRIEAHLKKALLSKKGVKWNLVLRSTMEMPEKYDREPRQELHYFRDEYPLTTTYPQQVKQQLAAAMESIEERLSTFMRAGSGWILRENQALSLEMADYKPLGGSSYIQLPKDVYDTKSVVNIQNEDQECFKWSILAALHPVQHHPERVSHYKPFQDDLNFTGIDFPVEVDQIDRFEKLNPRISVTVLAIDVPDDPVKNPSIILPHRDALEEREYHVVLLLWSKGMKRHYAWVKNLNRLLASTKKTHNGKHFCRRCLQSFKRQDLLDNHVEFCRNVPIQNVEVADEEICFKNWGKTEESLFRVYADFECILQECQEGTDNTIKVQKHLPCSVAWVLISDHPEVKNCSFLYRPTLIGEHSTLEEISKKVVYKLMESLQDLEQQLLPYQEENKPLIMTEEQEAAFQAATHCYMCEERFDQLHPDEDRKDKWSKVRDHNHTTEEFRGAAHSICNLSKKRTYHIPVFFHNLRGYDSHLIMQGIHRYAGKRRLSVIPNTMEKYVSFQLGNLRFLDSLQFLGPGSSLETLAKNLKEFPILEEQFEQVWSFGKAEDLHLLKQKGIYPYSYVKNFQVFKETCLPSKEAFKNDLTGEEISQENYDFAQRVWSTLECENLGEYHDVYLYQDIFLLADIFEQFRQLCLRHLELDPAHYYTVPGMSWDAALKCTKVKLETVNDIDMHLFLEKGMRGGISMISTRYAKANNPYLSDYDPEKPATYIMYKDANNLYGKAMVQPLPTGDFQWVEDISEFDVLSVAPDADIGYFLEVDLEYPPELHDVHSDYPLAPEKMEISHEMLSDYQQQLKEDLGYKPAKVEKLLPNLWDKDRYVIHYRNLQFYLAMGMKLKKIHRILQFMQSPWLKPYIEKNTVLRAQATNDFEKDFFKLLNNSVFGKTMEDVRRRIDIKLMTSPKQFRKHVAKVTYKRSVVFVNDEEKQDYFVGLEAQRNKVKLDKPIYTGFVVLELSKLHMYKYHYTHMMKKYGLEKAQLLFTDTDSLTYLIQTPDVYQDMKEDQELYDTSNYSKEHFLFSNDNKKVIGKFKDETGGLPITEWIGLRAKMYSILTEDGKEKKTGKGIKRSVLKKEIHHQDFKDCLFQRREYQHSMMNFRSDCHQMFTIKQMKKSLSPFDDKRYILADGFTTRAHGHYLNGISRPTKDAEDPELNEAMQALSLTEKPPKSETQEHLTPVKEHLTVETLPLPPRPSDLYNSRLHSYLTSFWK